MKAPPPQEGLAVQAQAASLSGRTTDSLGTFRASLTQSVHEIDSTLASLAALTEPSQTDLRGAYDTFSNNLARMQQRSDEIRKEANAMRATRAQYFANWEERATTIDNPTIRASADARRTKLRNAHERIPTASGEARDAYGPFVRDLNDIRKYLAADLSKSSVADLGEASKKVQASGGAVRQKVTEILKILDEVQANSSL